jgi:allantoinase
VHLSSAEALPLLRDARERGVPVTVETCTHCLWFEAATIPDGATQYKCAPPIRDARNREALWDALYEGLIEMVITDHSPCLPEMKRGESKGEIARWDQAWGGIASLGLALSVLWTGMKQRGIALERIGEWMAAAPARLAGMSGRKGVIAVGADADFAIFDPEASWTVVPSDLHFRHKISPYLAAELRGRVLETWLRGEPIFRAGSFVGEARGEEQVRS